MIRLSTLLFLALMGLTAFAAERPKGGSLIISANDNSTLRVTIDGRNFNARDNYFAISNIEQGSHRIMIYRSTGARSPFDIFSRSREELVFNNTVYVKKNTEVEITINRNGRARIDERKIRGRDSRDYRDWDDKNWDRNDRNDRDRDWDRNGGYENNGGYGNNSGYGNNDRSVSFPELQQMKETLRRENYENSRMGIARQMFDNNYFKADQVKELLQMFTFENYKLDLAKYAYRNTVDKNNYYIVNDVFSYSSSRQELTRYINQYR